MSLTDSSNIFKGIRFRLTLVYSLSFGLFVGLFSIVLTRQYIISLKSDFDSSLLNYAIELEGRLDSNMGEAPKVPGKRFPFPESATFIQLLTLDGQLTSNVRMDEFKSNIPYAYELSKSPHYTHRFLDIESGRDNYRVINIKVKNNAKKEFILQVAAPSQFLYAQERQISLINFVVIILLMGFSGGIAYVLTGRAIAPIKVVTDTVTNIAATNLSLRLPIFQTGDEIQNLSITFNGLLERLQKSFEAQEHFVSNASHQLFTPLTIIKGELNVLESKTRSIEEHQKFNRSLKEEIGRMIELVKNLLLIAQIEAGQKESFRMRPLRLDDLVITTMTRMKFKAREKHITIRLNIAEDIEIDDLVIEGERQLLDSMFENLLDNAIKYSPFHSSISIEINKTETVSVSVKDEGPGIRPNELTNILAKRFRRGEMTLLPGTGIGLSIVHKIAQHHKATISYERLQPQGSLFTVQFAKQIP